MIFNKRFLLILLRVLNILAFSLAMAYTAIETDLSITPYMFGGLLLIAVLELTWWLQKQERTWAQFLQSVKYGDFNRAYQRKTNSKELEEAYDLISESMEVLKTNREAEFRLLQTVLRHISVAVVCFKESGEIVFTNKTFNELLDIQGLSKIDVLKNAAPHIYKVLNTDEELPSEWLDHENGKKLLIKTERFRLKGQKLRLASITDIRSSLERKELESYQNLMRVMTHEIMNSTTPVLSLIRVVNNKLIKDDALEILSPKDQMNTAKSLSVIEERTAGILKFVEAYKQINKSVNPQLETVDLNEFVQTVITLLDESVKVNLSPGHSENSLLNIDRSLMTQVLINLIKNAHDAVNTIPNPEICIRLISTSTSTQIIIEDNGPGINKAALNEIFVPFFTSKQNGSGIGLAISKKIVIAHSGQLYYQRRDGLTQFIIELPQ